MNSPPYVHFSLGADTSDGDNDDGNNDNNITGYKKISAVSYGSEKIMRAHDEYYSMGSPVIGRAPATERAIATRTSVPQELRCCKDNSGIKEMWGWWELSWDSYANDESSRIQSYGESYSCMIVAKATAVRSLSNKYLYNI